MKNTLIIISACLLLLGSCKKDSGSEEEKAAPVQEKATSKLLAKGELFIIGGGKRPPSLIKKLLETAEVSQSDYIVILPMSSEVPDTSFMFAEAQFVELGYTNVVDYYFPKGASLSAAKMDSLRKSKLIYLPGGDQNRFMDIIEGTGVKEAIVDAYKAGATIAGTSAGAAVMSEMMITGNELKHADYEETFRNIEANNIEIKTGLGLITTAIIDQHFVKRSRHNRLISAVIEHPDMLGIGIDESTAIIVKGNLATVTGDSQVIVFSNPKRSKKETNGLLGAESLQLDVFLAGDKFAL